MVPENTSHDDLSVCILAGDDLDALRSTLEAARAIGPVVLAVPHALVARVRAEVGSVVPTPRGGTAPTVLVEIDLASTVAEAWNAAMDAAPTDVCLLLHAGEVVVGGRPDPEGVFGAAVIVEAPRAVVGPERLGAIRLVHRGRCRMRGALRPVLEVDGGVPLGHGGAGTVLVDLGARHGPDYAAWLHFAARAMDETRSPEQLVDLAALLAATGHTDAAAVRLVTVLGALEGELGRHVARMLAVLALRHNRELEVDLATREWQRLGGAPGPALALRGLSLLTSQRPGTAADVLDAALVAGLSDEDGVGVDLEWVLHSRQQARTWAQRSAASLPTAFAEIDTLLESPRTTMGLVELWLQTGHLLPELLEKFSGKRRATLVSTLVDQAMSLGAWNCLDLAGVLWRSDKESAVLVLTVAAAAGVLTVEEAVTWSRRLRGAGRAASCPLLTMVAGPSVPPVLRVLAAAALVHDVRDERGPALLQAAALDLHPAAVEGATRRLRTQAPDLERMLSSV